MPLSLQGVLLAAVSRSLWVLIGGTGNQFHDYLREDEQKANVQEKNKPAESGFIARNAIEK